MKRESLRRYLAASPVIDVDHPEVAATARRLAEGAASEASDVLRHRTGYCYAKSHLLAALLRANGIPAGLCYQRLSVGDRGAPYCLHGLNAVYLPDVGWYRIDARGNKPGIDARFAPPVEQLAFPIREREERMLPEIWAEPLPVVVDALARHDTWDAVLANLPDVELLD